ncbi:MAG: hypothetical protein AB4911_15385 [Oscillochloridaceae bacterium umkhey_bin13]
MTLNEAINDLKQRVLSASPSAVIRVTTISDEEASIRAYAPAADEGAIKAATADITFQMLTSEGLDVQVLVYDMATSLPPEE